jgi:hypothetical protein
VYGRMNGSMEIEVQAGEKKSSRRCIYRRENGESRARRWRV